MRQIITRNDARNSLLEFQSGGGLTQPPKQQDKYADKVVQYIPVETVSAYIVIQKFLETSANAPSDSTLFGIVAALFVLNLLYMFFAQKIRRVSQIILSSIALLVWIYSLNGPLSKSLEELGYYSPLLSMIALVFFSFVPPMFNLEK